MDFLLRPWRIKDTEDLIRFANNPQIVRFMTDSFPHPYTEEHAKAFIGNVSMHKPPLIRAIEVEGVACGSIGLHPMNDIHRGNAELGYWLAEPYWGRGIMPGAIRQTLEYGFEQLDLHRIFARPFGSNAASQRVLEKAGFSLEARLIQTLTKNGQRDLCRAKTAISQTTFCRKEAA
jgi:ribosomal-protein-alanine N-acetyltransferase